MDKEKVIELLEKRKKSIKKYLDRFEKQQQEMREDKSIGYGVHDMMEGISHQVGYMTGALESIKQTLELFSITTEDYEAREKASKDSIKFLKKQLKDIIKGERSKRK